MTTLVLTGELRSADSISGGHMIGFFLTGTMKLSATATQVVRAYATRARAPRAPIRTEGSDFDALFPEPKKAAKAWHGQDKSAYFHDKFAHVHAKQLQKRKLEQKPTKQIRNDAKKPRPDFAKKIQAQLEKDKRLEFVFGSNVVKAVLRKRPVTKVYTGFSLADVDPEVLHLCGEHQVPLETDVPMQHLNIMSNNGVHNKYVAATHKRELPMVSAVPAVKGRVFLGDREIDSTRTFPVGLYIDQVTDTHNMGALLRSASWFGVDFVAFSSRNCAPMGPPVLKASVGAAEYVPIVETPQPLRFFENLKQQGWAIVSSLPQPSKYLKAVPPKELSELASRQPTLVVVGSEGDGVRTTLLQRSTHSITLPKVGTAEIDSLNVSVACALILSNLG